MRKTQIALRKTVISVLNKSCFTKNVFNIDDKNNCNVAVSYCFVVIIIIRKK
jgi:hypothetical protein